MHYESGLGSYTNDYLENILDTEYRYDVPYQVDKVKRINEIINKEGLSLEDSYAYGDTINDLPMLMMCSHRFAVDPNEKLLNHPAIKSLEIVDWTK